MARLVEGGSNPWEVCGLDVVVWQASDQTWKSVGVRYVVCGLGGCTTLFYEESIREHLELKVGKKSPSTQFGISYTPLDVSRRHVCFDILSEKERRLPGLAEVHMEGFR